MKSRTKNSPEGLRRAAPQIVAACVVWLAPLVLIRSLNHLDFEGTFAELLTFMFMLPVVIGGTLAPCFLTSIGIAIGTPRELLATWTRGLSIAAVCALFILLGAPAGFFAAIVPISTSVVVTGLAAIVLSAWLSARSTDARRIA